MQAGPSTKSQLESMRLHILALEAVLADLMVRSGAPVMNSTEVQRRYRLVRHVAEQDAGAPDPELPIPVAGAAEGLACIESSLRHAQDFLRQGG